MCTLDVNMDIANLEDTIMEMAFSPAASPDLDTHQAVIPWPTLEGEATYIRPSQEFLEQRRSATARNSVAHPGRRLSIASSAHTRSSSCASSTTSHMLGTSPFPAPLKPLPPVPASVRTSQRTSSQPSSCDKSSLDMDRLSHASSTTSSNLSRASMQSFSVRPPVPRRPPEHLRPSLPSSPDTRRLYPLEIVYWKQLAGAEKRKSGKTNMVHYLDISTKASTVATKHGNSVIKFWEVSSGDLVCTVKISAYTEAHCRSRDYLIRSHLILSETNHLAAMATRFGRTIEIWDWKTNKRLQVIDDVDRWVAGRFETHDVGWSPLVAYRGKDALIDLFTATPQKKPYVKVRTIDVRKAGLPFTPQYPELALSSTSPLLVAAAGPRPPRAGHPPPDRETMLVTWDITDFREVSNAPDRVVRPWQHKELETALPCNLTAYGDLILSIWIPSGYRTVTKHNARGEVEYTLAPTPVPFRYVLVWDLSENSTRTYGIPNTTSCISPDCRFVAYSQVAERRSKIAILDAQSGEEVWSAGGEGNLKSLDQFGDLSKVTDLAFSADGRFLVVGEVNGNTSVYDVRESAL
ncbi:uncharacterized protein J7T54_007808 [Emericellopsis cladophorae]|uniref:Uncharacterized protein n=1 Tax=Emericellopsis cladophorae TaxID=2686198 RepID=A0A9Q0BHG3_9HYPO|nr:uncharacterized protein J7T54_007808 [Emericellopsis cladophorae]KAI6784715.1 hypothetical protein J7T54_007808 [Emericellopsis cladophorae]